MTLAGRSFPQFIISSISQSIMCICSNAPQMQLQLDRHLEQGSAGVPAERLLALPGPGARQQPGRQALHRRPRPLKNALQRRLLPTVRLLHAGRHAPP